jgi:hypothetical protein
VPAGRLANQPAIPESGALGVGALTQLSRSEPTDLSLSTQDVKFAGLRQSSVVHMDWGSRVGAAAAGVIGPANRVAIAMTITVRAMAPSRRPLLGSLEPLLEPAVSGR